MARHDRGSAPHGPSAGPGAAAPLDNSAALFGDGNGTYIDHHSRRDRSDRFLPWPTPLRASLRAQADRIDRPSCSSPTHGRGLPRLRSRIIQNDLVTFSRGYGLASVELTKPIDRNTVFDIASMSKQFTAASILLLAARSKLSLDEDVRTLLPELNLPRRITIRQLLDHTSGVRDYIALFQLTSVTQETVVSSADVMALLARQKELNFEPGTAFTYSNSGYFILGEVVRKVSGKSLAQFARDGSLPLWYDAHPIYGQPCPSDPWSCGIIRSCPRRQMGSELFELGRHGSGRRSDYPGRSRPLGR